MKGFNLKDNRGNIFYDYFYNIFLFWIIFYSSYKLILFPFLSDYNLKYIFIVISISFIFMIFRTTIVCLEIFFKCIFKFYINKLFIKNKIKFWSRINFIKNKGIKLKYIFMYLNIIEMSFRNNDNHIHSFQ